MSKLQEILSTEITVPKMRTIAIIVIALVFVLAIVLTFFVKPPEGNASLLEVLFKALGAAIQNASNFE